MKSVSEKSIPSSGSSVTGGVAGGSVSGAAVVPGADVDGTDVLTADSDTVSMGISADVCPSPPLPAHETRESAAKNAIKNVTVLFMFRPGCQSIPNSVI